ncbi:holo-[acyl-carrier-protein] synthase [Thomasclavelia cocleata]|uniref:Holo-[acyl-carrier-protein] synthase n=1 Tax=Thomasclavelia cocleata TaxID=69824 RepID=A0A1I0BQ17_9FIRM|nr:holo-ACP synthase [Thomasclavelia cocleata]MCR1960171.1 holo-ACP synthase [Thomasclavelia cocleata]NDO41854.1 holo-[acyl-carrier-protein] synthase [Thomasclavelia cocleata]PJN79931.1 holo-[acyl-carrier-protein] synthase [Thomasclavelia cocleata]SET08417.1 holo-[acyl-carrier protein] synthase [Thomasclavelia cocleata]
MIKGIGCDIVDLSRLDINNDSLALKILTAKEFEIYKNKKTFKQKKEFLGGRFAGKEAFFKAIGIEKGLNSFQDIEILNDINGKPYLNYSKSFISLAHENNYAVAYVIIEV